VIKVAALPSGDDVIRALAKMLAPAVRPWLADDETLVTRACQIALFFAEIVVSPSLVSSDLQVKSATVH
jgi:hypothetical protein